MRNKLIKSAYMLVLLGLVVLLNSGCNSSSGSVTSGLQVGNGYSINAIAAQKTIPYGGTTVLTAMVYTPSGEPIPDGEKVAISSSNGGIFVDSGKTNFPGCITAPSNNGTVVVGYQSPKDASLPSRLDQITFSYQGAITSLELELIAKSF